MQFDYLPLWTLKKHKLGHNFNTIETILIELHTNVNHHKGNILSEGHHPIMQFDKMISLYWLR